MLENKKFMLGNQKYLRDFLRKKYRRINTNILDKLGLAIITLQRGNKKKHLIVGKIQKDIILWAKNPRKGLMIIAPPGTGKTTAVNFALEITSSLSWSWINLYDIFDREQEEVIEEISYSKVVVIDEIRKPFVNSERAIFFLEKLISKMYAEKKIPLFLINPENGEYKKFLKSFSESALSKLTEITDKISYNEGETFNFRMQSLVNKKKNRKR